MSHPDPLPLSAVVGIDVVDRRSPRVLRGLPRSRTVDRVLAEEERRRVASAADPAAAFWMHWAAKEAAFKAVTLLRGAPPVFAHAAFRVDLDEARVDYGEIGVDVSVHATRDRLVVVATPPGDGDPALWGAGAVAALHRGLDEADLDHLRAHRFTDRERGAVRSLPSALARLTVRKEAAGVLELDETRLEVICPAGPAGRSPPYLHVDGRPHANCGVSISHDGDWVAWAVAGVSGSEGGS